LVYERKNQTGILTHLKLGRRCCFDCFDYEYNIVVTLINIFGMRHSLAEYDPVDAAR